MARDTPPNQKRRLNHKTALAYSFIHNDINIPCQKMTPKLKLHFPYPNSAHNLISKIILQLNPPQINPLSFFAISLRIVSSLSLSTFARAILALPLQSQDTAVKSKRKTQGAIDRYAHYFGGKNIVGWDLGEEEEEEVVKAIKEDVEEEEEEINDEKVKLVVMDVQ